MGTSSERDGSIDLINLKHEVEHACLIPGLPDDISMLCLARIPLWYHYIVRCVCQTWRDMFQKEAFWDVRLQLALSEQVLLFWSKVHETNLWHGYYPATKSWLKLPTMPDDSREKGGSTFAVVDEKLVVIGGYRRCNIGEEYSSLVSYFDMKRYEWRMAAPLKVPRKHCQAGVITNQLYVCGGVDRRGNRSVVEVYNPISQKWTLKCVSPAKSGEGFYQDSRYGSSRIALDNKFCVWSRPYKGAVYDAEKDKWLDLPDGLKSFSSTVTERLKLNGEICVREFCHNVGRVKTAISTYNPRTDAWTLLHSPDPTWARSFAKNKEDDGDSCVTKF